ncbi:MAG: DUF4142 domain-containing protein [Candidatus Eremiobacteraeota bacterium]|nr:DUF4142 domain-containing protein [Candidatus Eremiobacteraeota bacterium]
MRHARQPALWTSVAATALLSLWIAPSFAQQPNPKELTSADSSFLKEAIAAGDMEIAEGQAHQNSSDAGVRLFAQTMVRDHSAENAKLEALAKHYNVSYGESSQSNPAPGADSMTGSEPGSATHTTSMKTVATLSPAEYMRNEVADHQKAIDLFTKETTNGTSQDIKTAAAEALPILKQHLGMAQEYVRTGKITPQPQPNATTGASVP